MHRLLAGMCLVAMAAAAVGADDKPTKAAQDFKALVGEFQTKARAVKSAEERKELAAEYGKKFLALAEKNPKDPAAVDALGVVLQLDATGLAKDSAARKALVVLERDQLSSPRIGRLASHLAMMANDDCDKIVCAIIEKHPDRKVQAQACKGMIQGRQQLVQMADRANEDNKIKDRLAEARGKDFVAAILHNVDRNKKEIASLETMLKDKYSDVFPDLSVGKKAPELVSQGLDGKETKLSALRGKVVVLDIWATWCGPCRAMIPHERELVTRLKDKPFALISISADADKETVAEFIKKTPMPWTHWWNGPEAGVVDDWQVQYFPTIYVLDAKGVIRYKDVRGKEMDEAVDTLLKEMADGKSKSDK